MLDGGRLVRCEGDGATIGAVDRPGGDGLGEPRGGRGRVSVAGGGIQEAGFGVEHPVVGGAALVDPGELRGAVGSSTTTPSTAATSPNAGPSTGSSSRSSRHFSSPGWLPTRRRPTAKRLLLGTSASQSRGRGSPSGWREVVAVPAITGHRKTTCFSYNTCATVATVTDSCGAWEG